MTGKKADLRKRAFIFSLDIVIAVFLTLLMMAAAHRQMMNADKNSVSNIQMISAAGDVVALLDYNGVLQTLNEEAIKSEIGSLIPQNYDMMLKIVVDDGTVLYIGNSTSYSQFVGTGRRFFTIKSQSSVDSYAYVSYWIWGKNDYENNYENDYEDDYEE